MGLDSGWMGWPIFLEAMEDIGLDGGERICDCSMCVLHVVGKSINMGSPSW